MYVPPRSTHSAWRTVDYLTLFTISKCPHASHSILPRSIYKVSELESKGTEFDGRSFAKRGSHQGGRFASRSCRRCQTHRGIAPRKRRSIYCSPQASSLFCQVAKWFLNFFKILRTWQSHPAPGKRAGPNFPGTLELIRVRPGCR